MTGLVAVARRGGFRGSAVGVGGGSAMQGSMRALLVVMRAELVQLGLQLGDAARRWPGPEPALQGLVKPFGLALSLGVAGGPVLLADAEDREDVFERVAAPGEPGGGD